MRIKNTANNENKIALPIIPNTASVYVNFVRISGLFVSSMQQNTFALSCLSFV
jgi:hypothetical protein